MSPEGDSRHPQLRDLYAYWEKKRAGRAMPARRDIDPLELGPLLPNLLLVDVEYDPPRFRYRLVGTALVDALGEDTTGRYVDEMPFWFRKFAEPAYADVMARREPHYRRINTIENMWIVKYERLLLPLSSDGHRIDMILGGLWRG